MNKNFIFWTISLLAYLLSGCTTPKVAQPSACYLPIDSNVSYSQVTELPTDSPNAVLSYGEHALQFGELWLPSVTPSEHTFPLVIFIHGGCWLNQYDIKHSHALSTALTQSGYAVWSIEYRRVGDQGGGWPGSLEDIEQAILFSQKLTNYPIDLDKIALSGHSAGGHLALLAGAKINVSFDAVIGLAAIVDLKEYASGTNSCQTVTPQFMGGKPSEKPEEYNLASPSSVRLNPKTVLLHGQLDTIVPLEPTLILDPQSKVIANAGHFDLIHPGTAAYQQFLRELAIAFK